MSPQPTSAALTGVTNTPGERRRAAVTACAHIAATVPETDQRAAALELLRELGLAPDPHAIRLDPMYRTRLGRRP